LGKKYKVGLIILLIATVISVGCVSDESGSPSKKQKQILVDETRKIDAGGYWYAGWELPRDTHITGRLSVQDKDVDFYLIQGDRELESFKRLETFYYIPEYSKKNIQRTTFDFVVPEKDKYYFVISNIDSIATSKYVTLYIEAE
jgi:hypothetical protein